ncbi:MAG: N-acetyltransferase [Synergistaceae bacterium]|jgi:predicted GNAT family acetyltransferase|nr:N-acetyltransferase [Synergistaceae bacterium]
MNFISEYNRVYAKDGERVVAEVTFPPVGEGLVEIDHTFVDDSLRGGGVAGELMEAAYERIKSDGKRAIPTCGYAVKWFEKHEDRRDILAEAGGSARGGLARRSGDKQANLIYVS